MSAELGPDLVGKESRPPSLKKLSKAPSWLMLGFVLGAIFVASLPKRTELVYLPAPEDTSPPPLIAPRQEEPDFTVVEAVFTAWQQHAVWDADVTQIALWDNELGQYSRFYEVRRTVSAEGEGLVFYYRSIPGLTRPLLTHAVSPTAPLLFTEPDALRDTWLRQRDEETWGAIQESIRSFSSSRDSR